jgi:DNA processing protein
VPSPRLLTLADPDYPVRLQALETPPPVISVAGSLAPAHVVVAIVGTRKPSRSAGEFAYDLARKVVAGGGVVVSGGAVGIDAAAHEGALSATGQTWVVAGTGFGVLYPKQHGPLFERVVEGGGAMLWPFAPGTQGHPSRFLQRNAVLAALCDTLVVVQARIPSGALNAASWARRLHRGRWVVCPAPWDSSGFEGCELEAGNGAQVLTSTERFLKEVGLGSAQPRQLPTAPRNHDESRVLAAASMTPAHIDELAGRCGLAYPEVMTALLTLALENVLVEGPEGFYRRVNSP